MLEFNWTVLSYFIIALFALSGFFKGWWKEAPITFALGILVFLLRIPGIAEWLVERINDLMRFLWSWTPDFIKSVIGPWLGVTSLDGTPRLNPNSGTTWLIILILLIGLAILISRSSLPNYIRGGGSYRIYVPTSTGSFLGGLLGGLNGYLIVNLIREYLIGTNLPGGGSPGTEIAQAADGAVGIASSGVSFTITNLPSVLSLNNNLVAWIVIGIGFIVLVFTLRTRTAFQRFWISQYKTPSGYRRFTVK